MIQDQNGDSKIVPTTKQTSQQLKPVGRVKMRSASQELKPFNQDNEIIADQFKTALTNLAQNVFDSEYEMVESVLGPALSNLYTKLEATSPDRVAAIVAQKNQGVVAHVAASFQTNTTSLELAVGIDAFIGELLAV